MHGEKTFAVQDCSSELGAVYMRGGTGRLPGRDNRIIGDNKYIINMRLRESSFLNILNK